jgi:non-ribosomal peptide synthetase component F
MDFEGDVVTFELDEAEMERLKNVALKADATMFMVLLSLYSALLSKLSGQEDIVVGVGLAGRRHSDLQNIIGLFVNTLPLRNNPQGELKFIEFLSNVKEKTLRAFENQEYQFEELVDKVVKKRDWSRNPLFDAGMTLANMNQNQAQQEGRLVNEKPASNVKSYEYKSGIVKFDLGMYLVEEENKMLISLEYRTKLFKQESIERYIGYFKKIVSLVAENIDIKLKDIIVSPRLTEAESFNPDMELGF